MQGEDRSTTTSRKAVRKVEIQGGRSAKRSHPKKDFSPLP